MNKILETLAVYGRQDPEFEEMNATKFGGQDPGLVSPATQDPEAIKKDLEKRFAALLAQIETKDSVHPEGIER